MTRHPCPSCSHRRWRGTDEYGGTCMQCGGKGIVDEDGGYLDDEVPDPPKPPQE